MEGDSLLLRQHLSLPPPEPPVMPSLTIKDGDDDQDNAIDVLGDAPNAGETTEAAKKHQLGIDLRHHRRKRPPTAAVAAPATEITSTEITAVKDLVEVKKEEEEVEEDPGTRPKALPDWQKMAKMPKPDTTTSGKNNTCIFMKHHWQKSIDCKIVQNFALNHDCSELCAPTRTVD